MGREMDREPESEEERAGEQATVLVVDDNEDLRTIVAAAIGEVLGDETRVLEAADNVEALDLLLSAPRPLVVLLDRFMGPLPFDVLLAILASPAEGMGEKLRRHRYVVLTASPNTIGEHERELLLGPLEGAPIVGKPFDLDELEQVLDEALAWVEERAQERLRTRELVLAAPTGSR